MIELNKTRHTDVKFTLAPENYTGLYNKLEQYLPQKLMSFFAKPIKSGNVTKWYLENDKGINKNNVKSFTELDEQQKDLVSDYLEYTKPAILKILQREDYFKNKHNEFFSYPNDDDLKVILTDYEPIVILTQWACRDNSIETSVDKLTAIINRPKADRQQVLILIKYNDGSIADGRQFYWEYSGFEKIENKSKTDKNGMSDLKKLKIDSKISVYDIVDDKRCYIHDFTITEGQEIYEVILPLFADVKVKVVNQNNEPVPDTDIIVEYQENTNTRNTLQYGYFTIENLEVGKEVIVSEKNNPDNLVNYSVVRDKNEIIIKITQSFYADAEIKVINQNDDIIPDAVLLFDFNSKTENVSNKECISNSEGLINLNEVLVGSKIKATEKNNTENIQEYDFNETQHNFIFKILQEFYVNATIKVVNQDDEILPNVELIVEYVTKEGNQKNDFISNNEGLINLNEVLKGSEVRAYLPDKTDKVDVYTVEDENIFIFVLEQIVFNVQIIDYDDSIIGNVKVEFKNNKKKIIRQTDANGFCRFEQNELKNGKLKAKVYYEIVKKNGKKKIIKRRKTIKIVVE